METTDRQQGSSTRTFTVSLDSKALERRADDLVKKVTAKAFKELKADGETKSRVTTALANRFKPYILEAEIIAHEMLTPEYIAFKEETREFYGALVNVVACPDGRISVLSLTDPRVAYVHRVLRGQLPTRLTTSKGELPIPANTDLRAGVWTVLERMRKKYHVNKPKLVTLMGPHIDSEHPLHGCGAAAAALSGLGSGLPAALATMRYGGARNYFRVLQQSGEYYAIDNFVRIAGGEGTTIDYTHDLHSQGVIIGLGTAWKYLKEGESFRENLVRLHRDNRLVMSELLAPNYQKRIRELGERIDLRLQKEKTLDYRDPAAFAQNAMLIGRVTQELTREEEKREFAFLPQAVRRLDEVAQRIAAYHLLRNTVYLILGGIEPGKHWLLHHPEQVLRIGPIGADFNVKTVAFIETAPPMFSTSDMQSAFALYGLMERFLPALDVDLTREARIIMVTGGFDPSIYKDDKAVEQEYDKVTTVVIDDAAKVKMMVKRAISEGAAVVIPMIHHTENRSIIDVV